jgi:formiminotetrahydrofolate cyclodeaminase
MVEDEKILMNLDEFIEKLASSDPTPGGGSVAALSGALGTALTIMAARISLKKTDLEDDLRDDFNKIIETSEKYIEKFKLKVEEDAEAYNSVISAYKLPKTSDDETAKRKAAIQDAFKHAAEIPMEVAEDACSILKHARFIVEKGSTNCLSDSAVAVRMLNSAVAGGIYNVKINMGYIKDEEYCRVMSEKVQKISGERNKLVEEADNIINEQFN